MSISADLIRQLVARRESTSLDFKEEFYENSPEGNAELAKDLMAMANCLNNGEFAYILFGVAEDQLDNTGVIKGLKPQEWMTDSNLQQKVRMLLNKVPPFSWSKVDIDGDLVGVIEIRSGGRPFFPLKDMKALKRHVAQYRAGTSADIASPDQIVEWSRKDDSRRVQEAELERLEQELKVIPRLISSTGIRSANRKTQEIHVKNDGNAIFSISAARCVWQLREQEWRLWLQRNSARYLSEMPPFLQTLAVPAGTVKAGAYVGMKVDADLSDLRAHFLYHLSNSIEGQPVAEVPWSELLVGRIEVECRGLTEGRTSLAETTFYW